jgi:hypothetical protein
VYLKRNSKTRAEDGKEQKDARAEKKNLLDIFFVSLSVNSERYTNNIFNPI